MGTKLALLACEMTLCVAPAISWSVLADMAFHFAVWSQCLVVVGVGLIFYAILLAYHALRRRVK